LIVCLHLQAIAPQQPGGLMQKPIAAAILRTPVSHPRTPVMPITCNTLPRLFLLSVLTLSISACATGEQPLDADVASSAAATPGQVGGVQTTTITLHAEVTAIDHTKRQVTLRDAQGHQQTLEVGPDAINFNQVKVGDQVMVRMVEELAVFALDKNATAPTDGAAALIAGAEKGALPAALIAGTVEVTGTVTAIDLQAHSATLRFADGSSKLVKVRKDVTLREDMVGREVVFRLTRAVALQVERH
jgi:hypothetical protein